MNVNSPEFVAAWNRVSEALLHLVQVICADSSTCTSCTNTANEMQTATQPAVASSVPLVSPIQPQSSVSKRKVSELYAGSPAKLDENTYQFRRLQDDSEGRFFKVTTYDDKTCEFVLLNISDKLQELVDNQGIILAPAVAKVTGTITENAQINVTKPGKGIVEGRTVRITDPMEVSFNT